MPTVAPVDDDPFVEPVDYDPFVDQNIVEILKTIKKMLDTIEEQQRHLDENHGAMMAAVAKLTAAVSKPRRIRLTRKPDGSADEAVSE